MKSKFLLALCVILIGMVSCKKDEEVLQEECEIGVVEPFNFPTKVGTYWIYDINKIDSLGIVHSTTQQDSVAVIGDTLIDGKYYAILEGQFYGGTPKKYLIRDDGEGLVNEAGTRLISYNLVGDKVVSNGEFIKGGDEVWNYTVTNRNGIDNVFHSEQVFVNSDGSALNSCGATELSQLTSYEKGIGNIRSEFVYIMAFEVNCEKMERVLVDFYQP